MDSMSSAQRRKSVLIFALTFALLAALGAIIIPAITSETELSPQYYILCLSVIGCILLILGGYVWDRSLMQRLRDMNRRADPLPEGCRRRRRLPLAGQSHYWLSSDPGHWRPG